MPFQPGHKGYGGRPVGSRNKDTLTKEQQLAESGLTPLEFLVHIYRGLSVDPATLGDPLPADRMYDMGHRVDAAKSAAPYVHRKLPTELEVNNDPGKVAPVLTVNVGKTGTDG